MTRRESVPGEVFEHVLNRLMKENAPIKKNICPVCKREAVWRDNPFRPFCSERCKLIDLGKWAAEDYRVPGEEKEQPEGDGEEKNNKER